jgi:sulfur-oxidizing protein SoxY
MAERPARPTLEEAVRKFTQGREVYTGLVKLDVPPLVENGNAVGVTVDVDHPMLPDNYVKRIALFNEKNPQVDMVVFHLTPRSGSAKVSTRVRLATSQNVIAIAELTDGSFWQARENVIVTLAACIEDLSTP